MRKRNANTRNFANAQFGLGYLCLHIGIVDANLMNT